MLGDMLSELRRDKKITQEEFAAYIGITTQAYSKYEQNRRQPSYDILIKIATYYDVSLDYLLGRSKCENAEKYISKGYPQNVINIIHSICSLSKEHDLSKKMAILKVILNELNELI